MCREVIRNLPHGGTRSTKLAVIVERDFGALLHAAPVITVDDQVARAHGR